MVTPVEESGKKLCSEYWPSKVRGKLSFGNIRVTLDWKEHYPDYSIRQLMINPEDKSAANVLQFHFPSWPFMGVPKKPMAVIRFIRCIKEALQERHLPVLVHCSDGSGATGTLIAAFCLMDELETDDEIYVYEFVKKMRNNRVNMVQTKGQYTFLYDILLQAYLMPHSELSAKQLKHMTIREYSFSKEFQALKTPKYNVSAQSGASPENQGKNRSESIIPLDVHRPTLKCSSLTGGNNYINACFVDGYRNKNAFVMTQSPLPTTVEDFWRLVVDLQCSTIVMLNEIDSSDSKSCFCYWPIGGTVQYGNILVTCVSTKDEHTYVHRQFNVTHQSQKTVVSVDHFQLQKWPQKNISVWRDFIRSLSVEADAGPTIVHCIDGCGHSGVLVTVLKELQRLRQKQMVNVFETVQELRDNNPHAMQALEHYTLCYEILQELTYQTQQ